ncbi:MAG: discoidin domain-containing protein [Acidobacteria bacterium]|nr:discoidin domain-containing protein [Acidobacteriota bacterium]
MAREIVRIAQRGSAFRRPRRLAAFAEAHEWVIVSGMMLALSIATTWPLVRDARKALPSDLGDPLLNTFILAWDADRILHGLAGLWNAPFFFPLQDTLALSEHLLGIALFTAPLQWLTRNPVLVYNAAFLGSYVLAGTGMYFLARLLWGRRDAAAIGALAFAFAPYRAVQASHLQVLMSGWMPISLWGLHTYFRTGSRGALAVATTAFVVLGLSNGYFLYFFALPVAVLAAAELARRAVSGPDRTTTPLARSVSDLAIALIAVVVVFAPIAAAYLRAQSTLGLHRSLGELREFSATTADYLKIPPALWLWTSRLASGTAEHSLFPGVFTVGLAVIALSWLRRSPAASATAGDESGRRFLVIVYVVVCAIAAWLTLGPFAPGPYRALIDLMPGFGVLRVPARFMVIVALALAVLASAGAAWILQRLSRRAAFCVAGLVSCAIVLEGYSGPLRMKRFDPSQPGRQRINAWLESGQPGGVLELPISADDPVAITLPYQFNTLLHGHPIVNGYSGHGSVLQNLLGGPGSPLNGTDADIEATIVGLRSIGVRYVVLNEALIARYGQPSSPDPGQFVRTLSQASGQVVDTRHENNTWAWQLAAAPALAPVAFANLSRVTADTFKASASSEPSDIRFAFDNSLVTHWSTIAGQTGSEWIRIAFDRDRDIGCLEFDMGRDHAGEYPRDVVIETVAADGSRRNVFAGSVVTRLIEGIGRDGRSSRARIELPANRARGLWIRQTGRESGAPWTIAELTVWQRH